MITIGDYIVNTNNISFVRMNYNEYDGIYYAYINFVCGEKITLQTKNANEFIIWTELLKGLRNEAIKN